MNAHTRYGQAKELPAAIEAEQALLGAILVKNDNFDAIPDSFNGAHFFEPLHEMIFEEARRANAAGKRVNPVTIRAAMPSDQMVGDQTISQYLARLASEAVSFVNVPDYCTAITLTAMKRSLISMGERMQDLGHGAGAELDFIEQADAIRERLATVLKGLETEEAQTLADAAETALDATNNAFMGKGSIGVDYGFGPLMQLIGPFMPGQEIIIGGGTKQGKTALIEQIVMGSAMNGHPVWIYSGEVKAHELARRAMSRITDIAAKRQRTGKVSEYEFELLMKAKRNAETWQKRVFIHDRSMTMEKIDKSLERFCGDHENGLGVVDHVLLVARDRLTARMSDAEFGPYVTRNIKLSAGKNNIPIVAASQLKKNIFVAEKKTITATSFNEVINRRPKYTDLIGACEQDADHVIIPFRAEPILAEMEPSEGSQFYEQWKSAMEQVTGKAEIILSLSRHDYWPVRKDVKWNGQKTQFEAIQQYDQARLAV